MILAQLANALTGNQVRTPAGGSFTALKGKITVANVQALVRQYRSYLEGNSEEGDCECFRKRTSAGVVTDFFAAQKFQLLFLPVSPPAPPLGVRTHPQMSQRTRARIKKNKTIMIRRRRGKTRRISRGEMKSQEVIIHKDFFFGQKWFQMVSVSYLEFRWTVCLFPTIPIDILCICGKIYKRWPKMAPST